MAEYGDDDFILPDPFNSACPCQKCSNEFFWGHWGTTTVTYPRTFAFGRRRAMQQGDMSNQLPPRMPIGFKGVLATLPNEREATFSRAVALHRYRRAVRCFECNPHAVAVVWDWAWRCDVKVDGVRCGPECANSRLGGK